MTGVTAGTGVNATKEEARTTDQVTRASSKPNDTITPKSACVFKLPKSDTQAAFVAALLLKGCYITPPDVIYSFMHLTRLSAVVYDLRKAYGLGERLCSDEAPLTAIQLKRKSKNHFAGYWLEATAIAELAEPAQVWADSVLAQYPIELAGLRSAKSMGKAEVAA